VQGWICRRRSPDLRRQICGQLEAMGTAALFASSWWIELLEWLVEGAGEDEVEGNGKPENCGFFFFDRNWEHKVEVFHKHAEIQINKTQNKRK